MRTFSVNSGFLYVLTVIVVMFIICQSFFFLQRSLKQARKLHINNSIVRKTIISCIIFTIVPAFGILLGVITLSKFLGVPFPWLRLSVLGAITYELPAASTAAMAFSTGSTVLDLSKPITNPTMFAAVAWVMTLGIIPSIILIFFKLKQIEKGILKLKRKDEKWGAILLTSMFLGMISTFIGVLFSDIQQGVKGFIPLVVALCSALLMCFFGILIKKYKLIVFEQYALPLCMLAAMALAIPISMIMS